MGVFSSGTSASELVNLLESALPSESHEEFQTRISENALLSGYFYKYIVPICGDAEAAYFVLRHLRVRTKLESDLAKGLSPNNVIMHRGDAISLSAWKTFDVRRDLFVSP